LTGEANYSDDDAQAILRRAIEIEKQGNISETRLREIAAEAQISPEAVDRALAEIEANRIAEAERSSIEPVFPRSYLSKPGWALVFLIVAIAVMLMVID
jgi:hypothetical protein